MPKIFQKNNHILSEANVPEGHWGIFHDLHNVPIDRWDSFRTTVDKYGTIIGHSSQIAPIRAIRPIEIGSKKWVESIFHRDTTKNTGTFCRLIRGELPVILLARDIEHVNTLDSIQPESVDLRDYTAITIINLYTPMCRHMLVENQPAMNCISLGYPLIHLTIKHYTLLEDVPTEDLSLLLQNTILSHRMIEKHHKINKLPPAPIF
ncbi:MAG: hypothetical protein ACFFDT_16940, partial [Candidatus Hodarchaeota archaeon]